jgi:hypothetical protein
VHRYDDPGGSIRSEGNVGSVRSLVASCPACERPLGEIPPHGLLDVTCSACGLRYQFVRGRVLGVELGRHGTSDDRHGVPVHYGENILRLERANQRIETITLPPAATIDGAPADAGHVLSAVFTAHGRRRDTLLSIYNGTTGYTRTFVLPEEGDIAFKAWMLGGAAGFFALLLLAGWGMTWWLAMIGGTASGVGIGVTCNYHRHVVNSPEPADEGELTPMQLLVSEKLNLEEQRARVTRRLLERERTVERLVSLRRKMTEIGLPLYEHRIAMINQVLEMLDTQMALDLKLRDGYERGIKMIDIELDASAAAEHIEMDVTSRLAAAVEELHEIEETHAELARQVSASAEVEELLKSTDTQRSGSITWGTM